MMSEGRRREELAKGPIEERFIAQEARDGAEYLRCASRCVRRSEREENGVGSLRSELQVDWRARSFRVLRWL
jgi:hypothetical protein